MSDKAELEKQKLQAEIDEIKLKIEAEKQRMESEKKIFSKSNLGSWAAIIIALITIITGGSSIGVKIYNYFAQNEEAQKVSVDKEMINIVKELNSNDPITIKNNILLLSAYEMQAVPILLGNLEFPDSKPEPIIESLKLIKNKKSVKAGEFLSITTEKAKAVFEDNLQMLPTVNETITTKQENVEKIINHFITALKKLYKEKPEIEINKLFQSWKEKIKTRQPPVLEDNANKLIERLEGKIS